MNYIEKEEKLLKAYKENNFPGFDDSDDFYDFIGNQLDKFPSYANTVIRRQQMVPIWSQRLEGQAFRDKMQSLNFERQTAENAVIDSVNILNRMSARVGCDKFMDVDVSNRSAVANAVGDYINELYNNGIGEGIEGATLNKTNNYDAKAPSRRLRELDAKFGDITRMAEGQQELEM